MSQIVHYFLHSTSVLSFYLDVVLTLSMGGWQIDNKTAFNNTSEGVRYGIFREGINTLRPRQNGRHFTDDIFKCIFLYENVWIPIWISLKFVPKGPINNIPALVQIMAWRRPGDKPWYEPMMVRLPTHICVTRPQWVKNDLFPLQCCENYRGTSGGSDETQLYRVWLWPMDK